MSDRLVHIDNQETGLPKRFDSAQTEPPRRTVSQHESSWEEAFEQYYGYKPTDLEEVEMEPVKVKSALQGTKARGLIDLNAPGFKRSIITDDDKRARALVEELPTGAVFGVDQTDHETERQGYRNVVFFKKLSDGKLQPLRAPGPLRQVDLEAADYYPNSPRDIADTVSD